MEDGELPEEGEISDEEEVQQESNKAASPKATQPAEDPSSSFDAFLKKKREEMEQKVKNQLELAGVKATVTAGDKATILPDSMDKKTTPEKNVPKYRDLDPAVVKASDPTEAMMNSWMQKPKGRENDPPGGSNPAEYDPNEEYYGAQDRDYRWQDRPPSNEFGDRDYRMEDGGRSAEGRRKRERSRSPSPKRGGPMSKRRKSPSPPHMSRGGPPMGSRQWAVARGKRLICKFFREGYCRDGMNCAFSHDAGDAQRKPDLCKYYQQGHCRKSLTCQFLHGEWPCKAYHKGECSKDNDCRYSHQPLTSFTQRIFDQMMRDEELAASIKIPQHTKRKTLLGSAPPPGPPMGCNNGPMMGPGPNMYDGPPGPGPMGPYDHGPPMQGPPMHGPPMMDNNNMGPGPNPMNGPYHPMQGGPMQGPGPMGPPMGPGPNIMGPNGPNLPQQGYNPGPNHYIPPGVNPQQMNYQQPNNDFVAIKQEPIGINSPDQQQHQMKQEPNDPSYDINQMLQKIKASVQGTDIKKMQIPDESPASPVMSSEQPDQNVAAIIPCNGMQIWRLAPIDNLSVPNANLPAELIRLSMNDTKLRADPRIKKALESQFNAVSNMISATSQPQSMKQDPRIASRDPRLRNVTHGSSVTVDSKPSDSMEELVQMQLQMTAALEGAGANSITNSMLTQPTHNMPNSYTPSPALLPTPSPSTKTTGNPMLGGPALSSNPMLGAALGIGNPDVPVYQPPSFPQPGANWMPQMTTPSTMPTMDPTMGLYSSLPSNFMSTSPDHNQDADSMSQKGRVSRWNRSSPNMHDSDSSPGASTSPSQSSDKPLSMREKRNNMQYESPLDRAMNNKNSGGYNQTHVHS